MEIQTLKDKIQQLIDSATKLKERSKKRLPLLFQQLDEVKELETLERLEGKFLTAYLLWKSIKRANYQPKHFHLTAYDQGKLLEIIQKEVELIETNNQQDLVQELTNEELWEQLKFRLNSGAIARPEFISKAKELLTISKENEP